MRWCLSLLQGEYSGFVYSYAVEEPLSVGHKMAGYLPSLFWGFITLGRLISIPVSYRMKPATMVFINVVRSDLTLFSCQSCREGITFVKKASSCGCSFRSNQELAPHWKQQRLLLIYLSTFVLSLCSSGGVSL